MLHELLYALNGNIGGVFIENENNEVKIIKNLPFLQPSEENLLNRICQLATYYVKFQRLIKQRTITNSKNEAIYIRAFYSALDKSLSSYRDALCNLEKKIYSDEHLSAATFQAELEHFQLIFPALNNMIDQIENQNERGCQILSVIYKCSNVGSELIQSYMLQILKVCQCVLYRQLASWLLHGLLIDPYNEFFIRKKNDTDGDSDKEEDDINDVEYERVYIKGITGAELNKIMNAALTQDQELIRKKDYILDMSALPTYISKRVAETILFVGESVQMFEKDLKSQNSKNILEDKEQHFTDILKNLSELDEFDRRKFENFIGDVRGYVAEHLWKLIVENANFIERLSHIRELFLFGRGELYLTFIHENINLLSAQPTGSSKHDVNMALQQAARAILLDDKMLDKFRISIEVTKVTSRVPEIKNETLQGVWNFLTMEHTIEWPLHIILTKPIMTRYNTLFKFLFKIRWVQSALHSCWVDLMEFGKNISNEFRIKTRWWLRNHMSFVIDNLQFYLHVDVIESEFSILIEKIKKTLDFEQVSLAHDVFVASLLTKSFLLTKPISNCIQTILDLCIAYTNLVKRYGTGQLAEIDRETVDSISKSFQRQTKILIEILSDVRNHGSSPHIRQLLLRIDFNRYFSLNL